MTGFTVPLGFPYPTGGDPPDGAGQLQALAEAIDDAMVATYASAASVASPPAARITGGSQPTTTGLGKVMNFNSVYFDNDNMADLVADPQKLVVRTAGVYWVMATATFAPNNAGYEEFNLRKNLTVIARWASTPVDSAIIGLSPTVSALVQMAVGDTFDFFVLQETGTTVSAFDVQMAACRVSS